MEPITESDLDIIEKAIRILERAPQTWDDATTLSDTIDRLTEFKIYNDPTFEK